MLYYVQQNKEGDLYEYSKTVDYGIQDEFEVMENLYKLLRFKKSQQSITEYGGHTTDEVRKMFQKKREERTILA